MLSDEDRAAIEELHTAWLDAERLGQSTTMLDLCTAVPVWLPPGEPPLCGRVAILGWLATQPEERVRRVDIDDIVISGLGPFACKVATFRTTLQDQDVEERIVTGTHGWLLEQDGSGAWRIAVVTWTVAEGPRSDGSR